MIFALTSEKNQGTVNRLRESLQGRLDEILKPLAYEEVFASRRAPVGHYLFLDLDRLSRHELDYAAAIAAALVQAVPRARVLNHPRAFVDRVPLLLKLHECGINDFTLARLGYGERPRRYPVFLRSADGHYGPETNLIRDERSFDWMLGVLAGKGIPIGGRIAVGYAAEPSADGLFRKYGVLNIGGRLIPQHVMCAETWVVKSARNRLSAQTAAEELDFVRRNPHRDLLQRVFAMAGVDFGRIDYGIVGGRVQVYEINTNPYFPRFEKEDARSERRAVIRDQLLAAFDAIDQPLNRSNDFRFHSVRPAVSFELPAEPEGTETDTPRVPLRRRVAASLARAFRGFASWVEGTE